MVRVKSNPFQVDPGELEYHSLLDDSSNRGGGGGGGRSSSSRSSSNYYGSSNNSASATQSTSWVGNYAAIIAVVFFFAILYNGGYQESDPGADNGSTPTSTYSHHNTNTNQYEVDSSEIIRSEDTTISGVYDNSKEDKKSSVQPSSKSDQSEEEEKDDGDDEYDDEESVVDDAYSSSSEDGYDDDEESERGDYEEDDDDEWSDDDVAWEDMDDNVIDDDELKDDDIIDVDDDDDDYGDEDEYSDTDDDESYSQEEEEDDEGEEDDDGSNTMSTQSDDDDDDDDASTSQEITEDKTKKSRDGDDKPEEVDLSSQADTSDQTDDSDNEEKTEPDGNDAEEVSASTSSDEIGDGEEGPAVEDADKSGDHTSDKDSSTLLTGKEEDADERPSSDESEEDSGGVENSGQQDDDDDTEVNNHNNNPTPPQSDDANAVPVVEENDKDTDDVNEEKDIDDKSTKGIDSQEITDEGASEVEDSSSKEKGMSDADSSEQGESEVELLDSKDTEGEGTSTAVDGTSKDDNLAGGDDSNEKVGSEVDGDEDISALAAKEGESATDDSVQDTAAKEDVVNAGTQEANGGQDGSSENGGDGGPGATDSVEVTAPATDESSKKGTATFKQDPRVLSDKYLPRGKSIDDATKESLASTWGSWTFVDPKAGNQRPKEDFYADFPNRDVPQDQFPKNAWQMDKEYLSEFLPQSSALVERAMEAILSEYGHGQADEPGVSFDERSKMFELVFTENLKENEFGGTTNQKSFDGLVRRVLHSIMTESTFTFVMGGHSAAAGHGNHFQQSYTLQFQRVMEPVFARLGVKCTAHNFGYGGLGTSQNALSAGSMYGSDVDFLMWDSGMTEREKHVIDMFMRQGLIGGKKVPMLWGGQADILERLHKYAGADVGMPGSGLSGVPKTVDMKQALDLPWAVRYLDCEKDIYSECREHAYNGTCWINRPDFIPKKLQRAEPTGRAKWHPGNRAHQLKGRVLAFTVLRALKMGLSLWSEAENYEISDDLWHVTNYYDSIRKAVVSAIPKQDNNDCYDMSLPDRVCTLPIHGRTENTPRANPAETSIRSIIPNQRRFLPIPSKNIYDPPDVFNPALDVPEGEIDYLSIVENGKNTFLPLQARMRKAPAQERNTLEEEDTVGQPEKSTPANIIVPGEGWGLDTLSAPDNCDGSYDTFCNRSEENDCLLYGHNDYRGGLVFDGLSGWMVMNLEDFKHGIIMVKIEDWHQSGENKKTEGWKCENNDCNDGALRRLRGGGTSTSATTEPDSEQKRQLKPAVPEYCDDFKFQFAIDGKITTWNLKEWQDRMVHLQRVVQIWTLLDDETYDTGGDDKPSRTVELAIRATGCARTKTFYLTHVYWA